MANDQVDICEDAIRRLDRAFQYAGIDEEAVLKLKHPKSVLEVSIPVRMDDGSLRIFHGYRVRHDDTRGPGKCGIRFHPDANLSARISPVTSVDFDVVLQVNGIHNLHDDRLSNLFVVESRHAPRESHAPSVSFNTYAFQRTAVATDLQCRLNGFDKMLVATVHGKVSSLFHCTSSLNDPLARRQH